MDKIAVDAMGGDFAPLEIVKGAVLAVRDFHVPVVLVGDKEQIVKVLKDNHADQEPLIEICHASQVIGMGEHPGMAFRKKKDASVSVGAKLVKNGECGALVAPGSTGAAVTAGLLGMGRVDGIERPAILTPIPNRKDGYTFLIDSGASAQPKPETLLQNALMGYVYAKKVWHIENPRIGLLNIGEESTKGSPVVTEAYEWLSGQKVVPFAGNAEGRDIMSGEFDVILMDIMMPVMNGYEAAKMIRSLDREDAKAIPIIAMTANAFTEDRIRAKEAGMDEHVAKPVDVELLVKVIHKLVG